MDSIELVQKTSGKYGQGCKVSVSTRDVYTGIFNGFCESTPENPLTLRLLISKEQAIKIGVSYLSEIGVPYDVITEVNF